MSLLKYIDIKPLGAKFFYVFLPGICALAGGGHHNIGKESGIQ